MNEQKQRLIEVLDKLDEVLEYHEHKGKYLTDYHYTIIDEARDILLEELKQMED